MNLAVSNIAWTRDEEAEAAAILQNLGVSRVEVAPTKAWDKPIEASDADIAAYREWWNSRGFNIVALQSLNFGQPHFQIFQDPAVRAEMLNYLQRITVLGSKLGAGVMVFGSPKNRLVGDMPADDALAIAVPFFSALGQTAADHGVAFCIEPNPPQYGSDFVTTTQSGIDLVQAVNHPGFGLHLDAAGLTLAGDDPAVAVPAAAAYTRHFHVSAPYLEEVGPGEVDHATIAQKHIDGLYQGNVSIEMKPGEPGSNLSRTQRAVEYTKRIYSVN